jgi:hypothetical protein
LLCEAFPVLGDLSERGQDIRAKCTGDATAELAARGARELKKERLPGAA